MCRNKYCFRTGVEHYFQKIPAVQSQYRPAVRVQIADGLQPVRYCCGFFQSGRSIRLWTFLTLPSFL